MHMVSLFFPFKNNFIKNAQNWSECWTQMWNTWFHSAKSTVYNQYHRSREWLIRSARSLQWRMEERGMSADWWRGHQRETESGLIWFHTSVDERCQSSRVAFTAGILTNVKARPTNLPPLNILGRPGASLPSASHISNHPRHKVGFVLSKLILLSTLPFHQKNTSGSKKEFRTAAIQSDWGY